MMNYIWPLSKQTEFEQVTWYLYNLYNMTIYNVTTWGTEQTIMQCQLSDHFVDVTLYLILSLGYYDLITMAQSHCSLLSLLVQYLDIVVPYWTLDWVMVTQYLFIAIPNNGKSWSW